MGPRWWEQQHERFQEGARRCVHALPGQERWAFAEECWGEDRPTEMSPQVREVLAGREWNLVRQDLGLKLPFFEPQRHTWMVQGRPVQVHAMMGMDGGAVLPNAAGFHGPGSLPVHVSSAAEHGVACLGSSH